MVTKDKRRVTYLDFLELLLANLPGNEYKADSGSWAWAIYRLRDIYDKECPELFEDFVLIPRPPMNPHSEEVSHFLQVEQQGDIIRVHNPGFVLLEISEPNKAILKKRNAEMGKRYRKQIDAMVKEILPFVSLPTSRATRPPERASRSNR